MRLACCSVLLLTLIAVPAPGTAAELPPPLMAREEVDLPLIACFGAIWLTAELGLKDQFSAPDFDPLVYQQIGDGDRSAVGLWDPIQADVSDVLLYSSLAIPFAINGIDDLVWGSTRQDAPRWFWTDTVVLLQTVFFAGAITNIAKWAFTRYRPYMYIPTAAQETYAEILQSTDADHRAEFEEAVEDTDAALSFWSGHSALVFSAMTASATLMTYKHLQDHPAPLIAMWAGTIAFGVSVAVLRVRSGKHFPSDVIVGGIVGASCGLVIPALHRNRALPVAVAPIVDRDGGGLAFTAVW